VGFPGGVNCGLAWPFKNERSWPNPARSASGRFPAGFFRLRDDSPAGRCDGRPYEHTTAALPQTCADLSRVSGSGLLFWSGKREEWAFTLAFLLFASGSRFPARRIQLSTTAPRRIVLQTAIINRSSTHRSGLTMLSPDIPLWAAAKVSMSHLRARAKPIRLRDRQVMAS
jgi:hypothetical protein